MQILENTRKMDIIGSLSFSMNISEVSVENTTDNVFLEQNFFRHILLQEDGYILVTYLLSTVVFSQNDFCFTKCNRKD